MLSAAAPRQWRGAAALVAIRNCRAHPVEEIRSHLKVLTVDRAIDASPLQTTRGKLRTPRSASECDTKIRYPQFVINSTPQSDESNKTGLPAQE